MARRHGLRAVVLTVVTAVGIAALGVPEALAATTWSVALGSSNAESLSGGLPGAPTGINATCSGLLLSPKAVVTWNAVTRATTYDVYESSTSASSGYSIVATGVAPTTWTSANLGTGSFWFEVAAVTGSNWLGPTSSASPQISVLLGVSCT